MEINPAVFYLLVCLVVLLVGIVLILHSGLAGFVARDKQQRRAMDALSVSIGNQHLATTTVSEEVLSLLDRVTVGPTRMWHDSRVDNMCRLYFTRATSDRSVSCFIEANQPPPEHNQTILALMLKEGQGIVVMSANIAKESLVVLGNVPTTYARFQELQGLITSDPFR